MAEYHLPDELLLEYASGTADPGHALIAACHLTLCPRCREVVAEHEMIAAELAGLGRALTDDAPADDASAVETSTEEASLAERVLAELGPALSSDEAPPSPAPAPSGDSVFPWPLQQIIGPHETLAWRRRLPGLRTFDVTLPGAATRIRMVEAKADMTVIAHGHRGLELDLVLAGGLHDRTRGTSFERGDIQCSTAEVTHELGVLPGEPCLLLTINEGPFVPAGLLSRLVYGYLGWS